MTDLLEFDGPGVRHSVPAASATTQQHQNPESFAWRLCDGYDDQKRIEIKEEALEDGISQCQQLIDMFEASFDNSDSNGEHSSSMVKREGENLEKWMKDCKRHKNFQVLVGVAGPTGSGKTSALNALLEFSELLPTNNQEAATAVACKVAYNDNDDPDMRFRARVTFRTKEELERQLNLFFTDLERRNELQVAYRNSGSREDFNALRVENANLKPTFEMISTVFDVEEHDITGLTTQDLLGMNESVLELLGTAKEFQSSDKDDLAEQIKPYVDSTTAQHTE
ncbi:hypothetical protein PC116_g30611, partial [Phytophthora cactorum]